MGNRQRLHRVILDHPNGIVDHKNRNKLDNRKINLRVTDNKGNSGNVGIRRSNSSGYKGVSFHAASRKWKAQMSVDNKSVHIGLFTTPEEAARAYDSATRQRHGEFAVTNF